MSYKWEKLEPYMSVRYNYVKSDAQTKDPFFDKTIKPVDHMEYIFSTLGLNYWFTPTLALTTNASLIDSDFAGVGLGLQTKF